MTGDEAGSQSSGGARREDGPERAVAEFDERVIDILSWVLDTETRARIYAQLRQHPWSTSEEVAEGTGLYPSTVREALAAMAGDGTVTRRKRDSDGAGNNPYEYSAIPPSDLVRHVVGDVESELNALCALDVLSDDGSSGSAPVRIEVEGGDRGEDSS